jgi:hypothetical protein
MTWGVWRSASGFGPQIGGVVNVPADVGGGPVVFDAASSEIAGGATNILSWTHTPVGTPSGVVVGICTYQGALTDPTSVTYGGDAMTLEESIDTGTTRTLLYSRANPASGAQTVTINYALSDAFPVAGAITVTGGSTTDVLRVLPTPTSGTSDTPLITVTSDTNELVVDVVASEGSPMLSVPGDQTQHVERQLGGINMSMSTKDGATSVNMTGTITSSVAWGHIGASFNI